MMRRKHQPDPIKEHGSNIEPCNHKDLHPQDDLGAPFEQQEHADYTQGLGPSKHVDHSTEPSQAHDNKCTCDYDKGNVLLLDHFGGHVLDAPQELEVLVLLCFHLA